MAEFGKSLLRLSCLITLAHAGPPIADILIARSGLYTCISWWSCAFFTGFFHKSTSCLAGMSKSTVPLGSSTPLGPLPPGTHQVSQNNFQSAAGQQPHRWLSRISTWDLFDLCFLSLAASLPFRYGTSFIFGSSYSFCFWTGSRSLVPVMLRCLIIDYSP